MDEQELAKKLNPRLNDVLESVVARKGEEHAVAIERALKTVAATAHMLTLVPKKDEAFANMLSMVVLENVTKLVSIIGVDPEDLRGAAVASKSDMIDLFGWKK